MCILTNNNICIARKHTRVITETERRREKVKECKVITRVSVAASQHSITVLISGLWDEYHDLSLVLHCC